MKIKSLLLSASLAAAALSAPAASAATVDIAGGTTSVELISLDVIAGAGINVGLLGSATLDTSGMFPVANFDITGGTLDTDTGFALIEHDGSGVSLDNGVDFVALENFLINTETATLSGDISLNGTFVNNFGLFEITSDGLLLLTSRAATTLNSVFGTDLPQNFKFGFATVDVAVVPVPAALPLLISALAGLGFTARRRAA